MPLLLGFSGFCTRYERGEYIVWTSETIFWFECLLWYFVVGCTMYCDSVHGDNGGENAQCFGKICTNALPKNEIIVENMSPVK